jgi:hypothetical protein
MLGKTDQSTQENPFFLWDEIDTGWWYRPMPGSTIEECASEEHRSLFIRHSAGEYELYEQDCSVLARTGDVKEIFRIGNAHLEELEATQSTRVVTAAGLDLSQWVFKDDLGLPRFSDASRGISIIPAPHRTYTAVAADETETSGFASPSAAAEYLMTVGPRL